MNKGRILPSADCVNCGYTVSVVCKGKYGWLCQWCSDNELPERPVESALKLQELIKKRIPIIRQNMFAANSNGDDYVFHRANENLGLLESLVKESENTVKEKGSEGKN